MANTRYYTATEAAAKIGCSIATVSRWADRLGLGTRFGNCLQLSSKNVVEIGKQRHLLAGNPEFAPKTSRKR